MTQGQDHVVIVYQFGKVASTALVTSLNACRGVEAHQSHFLGDDALKRIVVNATGPNLSPYFRKHMVGQLLANLDLTHQSKRLQTGKDPRRLTVISLAREPLDWFRSSLQQDIAGYQDSFAALAGGTVSDPEAVTTGISDMLAHVADILERQGGAAQAAAHVIAHGGRDFLLQAGVEDEFLKTMVLLSLRPLTWFEDHFRKCFGFGLEGVARQDGFWLKPGRPVSFVLLRYEDVATGFQPAMAAAGVPFDGPLVKANLSRNKSLATEISAAFQSDPACRLGADLRASEYGLFFAYDATHLPEDHITAENAHSLV